MTEDLEEAYPEAAPYIQEAVEEHGEAWVLDNYYTELYPLAQLMAMPRKEELPFFDEDTHDAPDDEELQEMYRLRKQYIQNLKAASKGDEDAKR